MSNSTHWLDDVDPALLPSLTRWFEHMDPSDLTLIVLKGHLLIEEKLDHVIEAMVPNSQHLIKARITFFQKMQLARSLCWEHPDSPEWGVIQAFNSVRNDLAHNLESDKLNDKIQRLVEAFLAGSDGILESGSLTRVGPASSQVMWSTIYVIGFLARFEQGAKSLREALELLHSTPPSDT